MLTLKNIHKQYPKAERPAVKDVSVTIDSGDLFTLVGESGCGKTTLLRLIAGLETPDSGSIHLNETIIANERSWIPPEKRGVGLVFQGGALFPHLTIEKNIAYGLHQQPKDQRAQIVEDVLKLVNLPNTQKRYPHELSGGERQRIALARTIAPRPKVILLDEPFSNLDALLHRKLCHEISSILREIGTTSILVTHDREDACTFGNKIAIMRQGELQQCGETEAVLASPANDYCAELTGKHLK